MRHSLVVRLDNAGDVLLAGPAVRAVAAGSDRVTLLAGPSGEAAARLLPGVDDVVVWRCPWIDPEPAPLDPAQVEHLVEVVRGLEVDRALVLTSFHQSPLPTALLLRLAGVPWVGAISEDYPGSLLDLRHRTPDDMPEPERALGLAEAAGFALPPHDDGRLAVRGPLPPVELPAGPYVVLHPGTSVPARAWPAERYAEACRLLVGAGHRVVVTGALTERALTAAVVGSSGALDLGGATSLAELAAVLAGAQVVVVGNTGPAHLAAAVGTPVVSLFAPTVPAVRWRPYRVPTVLLGDQDAVCRGTRVTRCPFPGHPCLTSVTADDVRRAVEELLGAAPSVREDLAASGGGR
ncbi:MAG TPA: glycosyltransferase family 9 protein [Intrasporangium sp.]|uniref:glycosyltransferase family 9 protein n=1 Tax=Intrasporangium sp. TaxID=1925024 RepID=UPI002D768A49|nr:glycosyltransferase family 9 protein [Intrasporangium sp.]HET7399673.1 glycosyltransferase family 9 protein [Intrasporangium sp.]